MLWRFANGADHSPVMPAEFVPPIKSVGHGTTCVCDLEAEYPVWLVLYELAQDVGHRLRKNAWHSGDRARGSCDNQADLSAVHGGEITCVHRTISFLLQYSFACREAAMAARNGKKHSVQREIQGRRHPAKDLLHGFPDQENESERGRGSSVLR